ncbi:MAG: exodeoxyribonuclease III [Myxococcota bacterium]|nr:exodeoxyribonuclease III [Myxococcota bacterium]
MRVATWNINGIRARLAFLLEWLAVRQPDVVGLQELKIVEEQFPSAEIEAAGYHAAVLGQKSWNGVAVLSRQPLEVEQRGLPGQHELGARLLTVHTGGLRFTSVYCPNGKHTGHADFPRKLAWLDTLTEHVALGFDPGVPGVLCGDFNVCPQPIDSWNDEAMRGSIFHTDEERARIERLFVSGWTDLFRVCFPNEQAFTWWDYRGGAFHRRHGLRIDFVLGNAAVVERLRSVTIDRDWRKKRGELTPSDHAPVFADLEP